jgi:hypothetical protein
MINDGIAMISKLRSDPAFADKDLLIPMSTELFYDRRYRHFQSPLRTKFIPIVTPEARARKKLGIYPTGLKTYLEESRNVLKRGGMVAIALQAQGNQGALDMTNPTRAFSLFLKAASPGRDVVIMPVGISAPHAAREHKSQKGAHWGRRIRVDFGRCVSRDQLLAESEEFGGNTDAWAYQALATLLPKAAVKHRE